MTPDQLRERIVELTAELHAARQKAATPNATLPPLNPDGPRRKMLIEVEVNAGFEKHLNNQWEVEREIAADRWSWQWADTRTPLI